MTSLLCFISLVIYPWTAVYCERVILRQIYAAGEDVAYIFHLGIVMCFLMS